MDHGPKLRIDILTLFPEMFAPILGTSIPKRAAAKGLVEYHLTNFRDYAVDARRSVDDSPFGGGPGMVMMAEPIAGCLDFVLAQRFPGSPERHAAKLEGVGPEVKPRPIHKAGVIGRLLTDEERKDLIEYLKTL